MRTQQANAGFYPGAWLAMPSLWIRGMGTCEGPLAAGVLSATNPARLPRAGRGGRIFTSIVLLLVALHGVETAIGQSQTPSPDASHHEAVVWVLSPSDSAAGTGTLIDVESQTGQVLGVVITASHVYEVGNGSAVIEFKHGKYAGKKLRGNVVANDPQLDLCAIGCPVPPDAHRVPIAFAYPAKGDTVEMCGYGGGNWRHFFAPVLGAATHQSAKYTDLGVDFQSISGDSGGPILNQQSELVGVLWGGPNQAYPTHGCYGDYVQTFLRTAGMIPRRCPNGSCPQPTPQQQQQPRYKNPPVIAQPDPQPPAATVPVTAPAKPCECDPANACKCDNAKLIAPLIERIKALESKLENPIVGPAGPQGEPGKDGNHGKSVEPNELKTLIEGAVHNAVARITVSNQTHAINTAGLWKVGIAAASAIAVGIGGFKLLKQK